MDDRQQRLSEDLAGTFRGELRCDRVTLALYASDASVFQLMPLAVACPIDRDDVITLARYSAEKQLPLLARGAGTGVAGGAIGSGIVVDFSRHMKNVESIGPTTVRVQPGIVRDQLNRILRRLGRYFAPDPSNTAVTTVGGMIGVDAAGSHSVRVGATRDHVESLELVLAGGEAVELGNEALPHRHGASPSGNGSPSDADFPEVGPDLHKRKIVDRLAKLLRDNVDLIQTHQPPLIRNCAGYSLRGILSQNSLNAPRLIVGSEGTLGLVTAATLQTSPLPPHRGVVLLLFPHLESATQAVQAIAAQLPSACDLLDRRLLSLARDADARFERMIEPAAEAALIVEQTGFSDVQCRDRIQSVIKSVRSLNVGSTVAYQAHTFDEVEFLWSLPAKVVPLLAKIKGLERPIPFVEDIAVPPESLHEFLVQAQRVFQNHEVIASLYSHAAAGQVHLRPFLPIPSPHSGARLEAIARDLYDVVFAVGGTVSGEHGDGLSRTAFLRRQYGELYPVFQAVKHLFDPHDLMNPGKIVGIETSFPTDVIRAAAAPVPDLTPLQAARSPAELVDKAAACNGCGTCRTQSSESRMCPFFRIEPREEASPRAKANLLRNYLTGQIDPREWTSEQMKSVADLCFNCKQCQLECPSNIQVPQMMVEAKAAQVEAHGISRADWILSRAHSFGWLGSTASLAMNWMIANPSARWALEKLVGIARQRKLPLFARRSFLGSASRDLFRYPRKHPTRPSVAFFVGDYVNYHDPELGRALIAILKHNNVSVHVPPGQTSSGMAMISAGDLPSARPVAEQNLAALGNLAREGYTIICTEPSAALALKHEYPLLVNHPDAEVVAARVVEAGEFLLQLHGEGKLRTDFGPLDLDVGYHTPCHLRALHGSTPLADLLTLIPNLRLHRIERGCSGMAGAFGLTERNFRTSIRIGWELITRMREGDLNIGATECSGCKFQMEQGTDVATVHPLKLLALSYGLMPELKRVLQPMKRRLVVS